MFHTIKGQQLLRIAVQDDCRALICYGRVQRCFQKSWMGVLLGDVFTTEPRTRSMPLLQQVQQKVIDVATVRCYK